MTSLASLPLSLDVKQLSEFLKGKTKWLSAKWRLLGEALGLSSEALNRASLGGSVNGKEDPDRCLFECLTIWVFQGEPGISEANWESFIVALAKIGEQKIANEVYENLEERREVLKGDYSTLLRKGLERDAVNTKWTKFTISGPPGSGKSSAMKLLLDEPPDHKHNSTPVAKAAEVRKVNTILLTRMAEENVDNSWELMPNLDKAIKNCGTSNDHHFIYAVDTGGQAAFLDIAPALVRYNSVNIVTHRLDEKLDDKVKFYYSVDDEIIGKEEEKQLTHRQLLESSVRSLAFVQQPHLEEIEVQTNPPNGKPSFIVLGTYYDCVNKEEPLDKKNKMVKETLCQFRSNILQKGSLWIFPVNTLGREIKEKRVAKGIRQRICSYYMEAKIPARWLSFQMTLTQNKSTSKVLKMSECVKLGAATLEMSAEEVEAALKYYHDLTVILYFPNILPNIVFLDPQPLFDKLSDLVIVSFPDGPDFYEDRGVYLPAGGADDLKTKGLFMVDLVKAVSKFEDGYDANEFLAILENLFIIGRVSINNDVHFFLPCVLSTLDDIALQNKRQEFNEKQTVPLDPLLFVWKDVIPQGFFCALVLHLLRHPKFEEYQFVRNEDDDEQFRNAVCLPCYSTFGGAVLLIDVVNRFEIHYSGHHSKCFEIQSIVFSEMDKVAKSFQYQTTAPEIHFFCSIDNHPTHCTCVLNDDKTMLTCLKFKKPLPGITTAQRPWLESEHTESTGLPSMLRQYLLNEPNRSELVNQLVSINYQWKELGIALGVERKDLASLSVDISNTEKLYSVMDFWRKNVTPPYTWGTILDVISGPIVDNRALREDIEKFLAGADTSCSS